MSRYLGLIAAGALLATATAAWAAGPQNLAPGNGPGKVLSVQFGIQSPPTAQCPKEATAIGWIYTNFKGNVTVMIAREGQSASAPVTLQTIPASNGQYVATFTIDDSGNLLREKIKIDRLTNIS